MTRRINILMIPARRNRRTNPYTHLLTTALEGHDCAVADFSVRNLLNSRYDILHLHWPDHFAGNFQLIMALVRSLALVALVCLVKVRRGKIVWTVHDVSSLARRNIILGRCLVRVVMTMVNGFIFMAPSSRAGFLDKHPAMQTKHNCIIPHGTYSGAYGRQLSTSEARSQLGINEKGTIIGVIGDRKRHKGTETVLSLAECAKVRKATISFVIAGGTTDEDYAGELNSKIEVVARRSGVIFVNRRLAEEELAVYVQACDALILPYKEGWNSGLGLLALSYCRPIICSRLRMFVDMETEFGSNWVVICDTMESYIERCVSAGAPRTSDDEFIRSRMLERNWDVIAQRTKEFYERI